MSDVAGDQQSGTADADVAPVTDVAGDRQSGTVDDFSDRYNMCTVVMGAADANTTSGTDVACV